MSLWITAKNIYSKTLLQAREFLARDRHVVYLIITAAILVYALCLPNQMFWDDDDFILKNAYIKDWQFWTKFFTENIISGGHLLSNYWRPLLEAVFAVEWHLWADWVCGWHAVSILCHAAAGSALFFVLKALGRDRTLAIAGALLWVVHPVHTEAVVYPNSMGDSLATLFVLLGIYFYTRGREGARTNPRYYMASLAMYPLALLSKETGILLVAFIALADFLMIPDATAAAPGHCRRIPGILVRLSPFILMALAYIALRATVLNFNNSFNFYNHDTPFTTQPLLRLAAFLRVIALDAGFIFIPYDLRVERLIEAPGSFLAPDVLWGGLIVAGLIGLAIRNWARRPAVTFGVLWFFTAILPTSNLFVIINALVYEHFLYMALMGIIIVVLTLGLDGARNDTHRRKIFMTVVCMAIVLLSARSAWRCTDWRTAIGFYEKLVPTAPKSYRVLNNLGMAYAEKGITDKAEATYLKAITLDPSNAVAYHNVANIYRDRGDKELARQNYTKAIELQPNFIFSYKSLAQIYLDKNEYSKARAILEQYFLLADEKIPVLNILTEIAWRQGAYTDARRYLLTILQLDPGNPGATAALEKLKTAIQK